MKPAALAYGAEYPSQYAPPPPGAPPVARFTSSPDPGTVDQPVRLDATGSTGRIRTYDWVPGDGTPMLADQGAVLTHTYTRAGRFTAAMRVTDRHGRQDTTTGSFDVVDP